MKESASIRVVLDPSSVITRWLSGIHAATLLPLWWTAPHGWIGAALTLAVAAHGVWAVRRFGQLKSPRSVTAVELQSGGCVLTYRDGRGCSGAVAASTVVMGPLVILAVADSAGRLTRHALIAGDMLAGDDFRRLRVALKWGAVQEPGRSQA